MPLYGNELDREHNPYEANLGRLVKLEKDAFMGRAALGEIERTGPERRLVGLVMRDNAIARHGYPVRVADGSRRDGDKRQPVADARRAHRHGLSPDGAAAIGSEVEVVVRDRPYRAEQVKLPFYRRSR